VCFLSVLPSAAAQFGLYSWPLQTCNCLFGHNFLAIKPHNNMKLFYLRWCLWCHVLYFTNINLTQKESICNNWVQFMVAKIQWKIFLYELFVFNFKFSLLHALELRYCSWFRDSPMGWTVLVSDPTKGKTFFSSPKHPNSIWVVRFIPRDQAAGVWS
jgi:hypothetical protein